MKKWKPLSLCVALLVGGFALAQDTGFQPPINQGLNLPIPSGVPSQGLYTVTADWLIMGPKPPAVPTKSRTDGMTAEQIAGAIEAVRIQRTALDEWEAELLTAGQNRRVTPSERVAKWGVFVEPPPPPAQPPIFSFLGGLYGGQ